MNNWVRNNKMFVAFLVLFGVLRTAVADWNPIPSASMHPNLLEGDVVLVNRIAFDLKVPLTDMVLA
ncbi:MAG: signal peptidase I, partial [Oxalobacteraceae bacterium]